MQRLPTAKYMSVNIILWGVFLALQAVSKNFATLAVLRGLSGAAEACADPSFMIITSMWYKRSEQPIRIGIWYSSLGLGIAGGGVLGYGIGKIKGSLPSWKYEFVIIGALCVLWGIVMLVVLPDSPLTTQYLNPAQRTIMIDRLRENQTGIENRHFKMHQFLEAITDFKVHLFFLIAFFQAIVNGGVTNFGTLIIQGFGFSTRKESSALINIDTKVANLSQSELPCSRFHMEYSSLWSFFPVSGLTQKCHLTVDVSCC
jgi:MFS family permease